MSTPLIIQFLLCPVVLLGLSKITAPYGRHFTDGWGPGLSNRSAWILMELPALLVISVLVLIQPDSRTAGALVPLALWAFHYSYRSFVFPLLMRPSHRTFPTVLVLFAVGFNTLNGYNNAEALNTAAASGDPLLTPYFLAGVVIFVTGFIIHAYSDWIIRELRQPGEVRYRIPEGGLFGWVSSPHYLGEIIQWCGWAVLTWSWAGVAFALFTFCNLAPRAVSNQVWYRQRFSEYPRERRILIPGIF
jgi:hypothetical protein